jgi:hypothetical protein
MPGGLYAIELWHGEIHDNYVGAVSEGKLNGFLSIGSFGYYLEVILLFEQLPGALPDHSVVFSQQDSDGIQSVLLTGSGSSSALM